MNNLLNLSFKEKCQLIENKRHLDIFINDPDFRVRAKVANQGYGLDILINDSSLRVRGVIARQGYGLNKLIGDKSKYVRDMVLYYCKRHRDQEECKNILKLYNL